MLFMNHQKDYLLEQGKLNLYLKQCLVIRPFETSHLLFYRGNNNNLVVCGKTPS